MARALTPIKHDGVDYAAGDEVPGLTEEQEAALVESGALESEDNPYVEPEEEEVEVEAETEE